MLHDAKAFIHQAKEPFFLYFPFTQPHIPFTHRPSKSRRGEYFCAKKENKQTKRKKCVVACARSFLASVQRVRLMLRWTESKIVNFHVFAPGLYGDQVNEMHFAVGEILQLIKDLGMEKNTLSMFVSDHGGQREMCAQGGNNGPFFGASLTCCCDQKQFLPRRQKKKKKMDSICE